MSLKPVMNRWNVQHGDIVLVAPSILKIDNESLLDVLIKTFPCKQVGNDLIELPKGLVLTIKRLEVSSYRDNLTVSIFKSKQTVVPINKSINLYLHSGDFQEVYFDKI